MTTLQSQLTAVYSAAGTALSTITTIATGVDASPARWTSISNSADDSTLSQSTPQLQYAAVDSTMETAMPTFTLVAAQLDASATGWTSVGSSTVDDYDWITGSLPGAPTTLISYTPTTTPTPGAANLLTTDATSSTYASAETVTTSSETASTALPLTGSSSASISTSTNTGSPIDPATTEATSAPPAGPASTFAPASSSSPSSVVASPPTPTSATNATAAADSASAETPGSISPPLSENDIVLGISLGILGLLLLLIGIWRYSVYARRKLREGMLEDEAMRRNTQASWDGGAGMVQASPVSRFSATSTLRRSRMMGWFRPLDVGHSPPGAGTPPNQHWAEKYVNPTPDSNGVSQFQSPFDSSDLLGTYGHGQQGKSGIASSQALESHDFNPPTFTLTRFDGDEDMLADGDGVLTRPLSLSGLSGRTRSPTPYDGKALLQAYANQDLGLDSFQSDVSESEYSSAADGRVQSAIRKDVKDVLLKNTVSFGSNMWASTVGGIPEEPTLPAMPDDSQSKPWYQRAPWLEQLRETGAKPYLPPKPVAKGAGLGVLQDSGEAAGHAF